jgi:pimeloyl-ACP methyl ester carboxylesterase
MKSFNRIWILAALFLKWSPALADDVITNVMSPIVSYQYPDDFSSQALTNGGILSPIASYQYFEWPGDDVLHLQSSPWVSFYYQFLDAPLLNIFPTLRTPTVAETTPAVLLPPPTDSQLKTFYGGVFTTSAPPLNPARITIVLTHGWRNSPGGWAADMAALILANVTPAPNIVAWDWEKAADTWFCNPGKAEERTPEEGRALGQALLTRLGAGYAQPIHFIGHSLGTLVNSYAANWLHGDRWALEATSPTSWSPTNTHLTLFDEAEAASDQSCSALLQDLNNRQNPLSPRPYYDRPLPKRFAWADNFISAFGLLHPEAANVILTNGLPDNAPDFSTWKNTLSQFHSYPCQWYDETVTTDISAMGHRWSFERGGFSGAPAANTVFVQANTGSEWNLVQDDYADASAFLSARFQKYLNALAYALTHRTPDSVAANGAVTGEMLATGPANAFDTFILYLLTAGGSPPAPMSGPHPMDGGGTNAGAYAWLPLTIPADAVSMSFDFKIQGDWKDDSLAAALNGTNVFLLAGSLIETNLLINSGAIDVSAFAGQTNELFVGIVGGTSTNAQLTVQNVQFLSPAQPSLQVQASGSDLLLSWPLWAQDFSLQTTINLADANSWTAVTSVPAIVDLRNTVTNSIEGGAKFFRLKK